MIKQEVVDKILDTARIDEVVGDFVALKKRGASLIGNCPFHNEKTPSFNVSISRGIYKCFGCGAAGDSVRFVMEHEKYSYPEALRYLANKYQIEVEETELTQEQAIQKDQRESLFIVTNWAGSFFEDRMWNSEEGQAIALSYFRERGYREDIIKKFGLGYSPDAWTAMTDAARSAGYKDEYLVETGLTIQKDDGSVYDRFRGRVMFPIHNLTGRILGFGGRTLKQDKKSPKYVNSPESIIYHKSNVLYGIYFAKKAIAQADKCYLVEGYADVIGMHQAGIENVVASSGTSLTEGQIKLISRYTKRVSILYDGDDAGIQATLRGTDMLLEEGLDVQIVLFPEGDDPDSYIRKNGTAAFQQYIAEKEEDFIKFKTRILLKRAGNDPIARANTIREVVESIALIPNEIKVSVFIQECSRQLGIEERVLLHELNKIRMAESRKKRGNSSPSTPNQPSSATRSSRGVEPEMPPLDLFEHPSDTGAAATVDSVEVGSHESTVVSGQILQEREFIRVLLNYGHMPATWNEIPDVPVAPLLINSIRDVRFEDPAAAAILELYTSYVDEERLPEDRVFISNPNPLIAELAISCFAAKYTISPNWNDDKRKIYVPEEKERLEDLVFTSVYRIKKRWIEAQLHEIREELKTETDDANLQILIHNYSNLREALKIIGDKLGTIVVK